jgi:hypothetical protein
LDAVRPNHNRKLGHLINPLGFTLFPNNNHLELTPASKRRARIYFIPAYVPDSSLVPTHRIHTLPIG